MKNSEKLTYQHPIVSGFVIEGAALVNFVRTSGHKTFSSYAKDAIVPHLMRILEKVVRLDVVWDVYHKHTLKNATRQKGGKGTRRMVSPQTMIPDKWDTFLRDNQNKTELFHFYC